jgi:hypothetical protein
MPEFRRVLDVYQGYDYKKDKQTPVGFITKLRIGDTEVKADQTCKDPTNPETDLKVVAVLTDILWETGVTDAVYFSGQVSTANKQTVALMVYKSLVNIDTNFQFAVYEYDPIAKKYFLSFHCKDTEMKGLLEKKGDELNLSVANDASTEVPSPENYTLNTGIKPKPEAQTLHVATGDQKNVVKAWGLKLG